MKHKLIPDHKFNEKVLKIFGHRVNKPLLAKK